LLLPSPPRRGRGEKRAPSLQPLSSRGARGFPTRLLEKGHVFGPGARGPTVNLHPTRSGGKTAGPRESLGATNFAGSRDAPSRRGCYNPQRIRSPCEVAIMGFKLDRVHVWSCEVADQAGGVAAKLALLAQAGSNLEYIYTRRREDQPGTGILYVAPVTGPLQ